MVLLFRAFWLYEGRSDVLNFASAGRKATAMKSCETHS